MILGCLFSRDSSPSDSAVPKNSITLKNRFEFCRSSFLKVCSLISCQNRFSRRKKPSNNGNSRLLPPRRNGCTVTTNHLFLPGHRRKAVLLLPIAQPNCDLLGSKCTREGGRGSAGRHRQKCHIDHLARKFYPKWRPLPRCGHFQKEALESWRAIPTCLIWLPSSEPAANY